MRSITLTEQTLSRLIAACPCNAYRSKPVKKQDTKLRIVRLLEPSLCLSCQHASIATVEMSSGVSRRMLHCKRLDCDNWQTEEMAEIPRTLSDDGSINS